MNETKIWDGEKELIVADKIKAVDLFTDENILTPFLAEIEKKVMSIVPDMTTATGRKYIASIAYKVAQTKTLLDGIGKDEVAKLKDLPKKIDSGRKTAREFLEKLQADYRKPLTDWEESERLRIEKEEADRAQRVADIEEMNAAATYTESSCLELPLDAMVDRLKEISDTPLTPENWGDKLEAATSAKESSSARITAAIERRKKYDADQAELARLQQAEADRKAAEAAELAAKEQAEREARIAKEAAEAARIEAEKKVKEAESAAAKAEADRIAAEAKAKSDAEEADRIAKEAAEKAAAKAEEDKQEAVRQAQEKERKRVADEQAAKDAEVARAKAEADKMAANRKHQTTINREVLACFVKQGLDEAVGKTVITLIATGTIKHCKITY